MIDEQNKDARHSIQNSNKQKLATLWINAGEVVLGEGLLIESRLFDKSELLEEIKVVRSSVESVNQSIEKEWISQHLMEKSVKWSLRHPRRPSSLSSTLCRKEEMIDC